MDSSEANKKQNTAVAMAQEIAAGWGERNVSLMAAAIAFYSMMSLAPLLAFVIGTVGFFFSESVVEEQILASIRDTLGPETSEFVAGVLESAFKLDNSGPVLIIIGVVIILFFASTVFNSVKMALNVIWDITPEKAPYSGILAFLWNRFWAAIMVLLIGSALFVLMMAEVISASLGQWISQNAPEFEAFVSYSSNWLGVILVFILLTIAYRVLPDVRLRWRQVLPGSLLVTLLILIGNQVMGIYFSLSSLPTIYGAAGSLVVVLLWVYYSSYIFLFGALFTKAFARRFGRAAEA